MPAPGKPQTEPVVIRNGILHTVSGDIIPNGAVRFENGIITHVGPTADVPTQNAEVIDVQGSHIYPGLIACNTTLGLVEISAVRATRDFDETGSLNPNVRSLIAYNTDSRIIPTIRNNGMLLAQIVPQGGRIPGTSSVVQLDAWNWEDAAYETDNAVHLNWPSMYVRRGWWAEPGGIHANDDYMEQVDDIFSYFREAGAYAKKEDHRPKNLRFEAMRGLFTKDKKLFVAASSAREIKAVVRFLEEFDLEGVIVGADDAHLVADLLAEKNVAVIYKRIHSLPLRQDDDIAMVYSAPAKLYEAGVTFALSLTGSWEQRNLPFMGGSAAAHGLSKEAALKSLTLYPAQILGIDDRTGSLESGKDANIIVSTGDVMDMRTNDITHAFIQGRVVDLDDKQKRLYEKFMQRYE